MLNQKFVGGYDTYLLSEHLVIIQFPCSIIEFCLMFPCLVIGFCLMILMWCLYQELLAAGGTNIPRTADEVTAHLAFRLARWDDR
jgi:hypothetical protein